jgi:hypothetical protein
MTIPVEPAPLPNRIEYHYTEVATDVNLMFTVQGVADDVAIGIRNGLRTVNSIKDIHAYEIVETRTLIEVPGE